MTELSDASVLKRIDLLQEEADLRQSLKPHRQVTMTDLEADFVMHAKGYSERKGITRSTWRKMGVPIGLLTRAGITA